MTEQEAWQQMMRSCRKACKVLSMEFKEPDYLNWGAGRSYHRNLWAEVKHRRAK